MAEVSLKQKTIKGLFWSAVDSIAGQGITFVVLIVLARLLSPAEFGLIGLTALFIAIAQVIIEGGLNYALIRKQDCTDKDYSTAFYYNVSIGIIVYFIFYFTAPLIAKFFNQLQLISILRVLGICLIVGSLTSIQQTILTKRIDFKSQAVLSLIAAFLSGGIAIYMAYTGWGVWALVWRLVLSQFIRSLLLWIHNKWIPRWIFDMQSFKELFYFGNKLMLIYLIATIFKNIYNAIIGKFYTITQVGYYNNADQYANTVGGVITQISTKVTYPVFSTLQEDKEGLRRVAKRTMESIMFITFHIMIAIVLVAKPLVLLLMGEKWEPSVVYLQALCLAYMALPMHSINQNIMNALGRSDLFLKTELIKYALFVPIIIAGIVFGIKILMIGFIFHYWVGYFINAWYTKKLINYSIIQQLKDILPSLIVVFISACITIMITYFYKISELANILQVAILIAVFITISFITCVVYKPIVYKEFLKLMKKN